MLTDHTLNCAMTRLIPESHWLVNCSFLVTGSFCKRYLYSVTSWWCTLVNPFVVVHPTQILVHPRVHRAHRLKSAGLEHSLHSWCLLALSHYCFCLGSVPPFYRDVYDKLCPSHSDEITQQIMTEVLARTNLERTVL